jgi:hypothetical protein
VHAPGSRDRDRDRVDERQVVRRDDDRAVFGTFARPRCGDGRRVA